MLILSRTKNESIIIGDDVVVTVLEIKGSQVRLGIKAPNEVDVDRVEVRERILAEQADSKRLTS